MNLHCFSPFTISQAARQGWLDAAGFTLAMARAARRYAERNVMTDPMNDGKKTFKTTYNFLRGLSLPSFRLFRIVRSSDFISYVVRVAVKIVIQFRFFSFFNNIYNRRRFQVFANVDSQCMTQNNTRYHFPRWHIF